MQTLLTEKQKNAWIRALRSGKYPQGKSALYDKGEYCCLGVLCKINRVDLNGKTAYDYIDKKLDGRIMPVNNAKMWNFVTMNDTNEWPFKKIATWIEKNVKTK